MKKLILSTLILISLLFTACGNKEADTKMCEEHKRNCPKSENCPEHPECEAHEKCTDGANCKEHPSCAAFDKKS